MTILKPGDLLTAIRIPNTWAGARFYFEKVADRQVWDFPLVNVASAMRIENGVIKQARIVVGGVAPRPRRLKEVEDSVRGQPPNEETAELAGKTAIWGARPLNHNHFKIPLMKNLVKRAI
jgi:xanthine dehydrogenase YagS FAD-binding subunit